MLQTVHLDRPFLKDNKTFYNFQRKCAELASIRLWSDFRFKPMPTRGMLERYNFRLRELRTAMNQPTGAEQVLWDLSIFYAQPDDPAIARDLAELQAQAERFAERYRGRVAQPERR
jgi:hypothetical protein